MEFGRVVTSTPARVSCIASSDRSEETEITCFHLEPCLESIPPLEESGDQLDAYQGRRGEEVRRSQETADLGSRRTRTRGSQDVTAADKSEVGRAIRGPRDLGFGRPSGSITTNSVACIVLLMLWQIRYLARAGTLLTNRNRVCYPRDNRATFLSRQEKNRVSAGISCDSPYWTENCLCIMYLVALLHPDCI